jgi:hypothetical protein
MVDPPSIGSSDSLSIVEVNNTFGIIKFIAIQPTPVAEGCPGLNGAPTNPTEIYLCTSFKTLDLFPNGAGDLELLTELTFNQSSNLIGATCAAGIEPPSRKSCSAVT